MTTSTGLSDDNCTLASALPASPSPSLLRVKCQFPLYRHRGYNHPCIVISKHHSHLNGTPQVQRQKAVAQNGQGLAPKSHRPELKSYSGVEDVDMHFQVHWQRSRMTTLVKTFSESSFGRKSL